MHFAKQLLKNSIVISESILVPSEIILTPTTNNYSSYRVDWTQSYYNTSRYLVTVCPSESYTQEDLIIHNSDSMTLHNITIALNDCPHRIYSTFILGTNIEVKIRHTFSILSCLSLILFKM